MGRFHAGDAVFCRTNRAVLLPRHTLPPTWHQLAINLSATYQQLASNLPVTCHQPLARQVAAGEELCISYLEADLLCEPADARTVRPAFAVSS